MMLGPKHVVLQSSLKRAEDEPAVSLTDSTFSWDADNPDRATLKK